MRNASEIIGVFSVLLGLSPLVGCGSDDMGGQRYEQMYGGGSGGALGPMGDQGTAGGDALAGTGGGSAGQGIGDGLQGMAGMGGLDGLAGSPGGDGGGGGGGGTGSCCAGGDCLCHGPDPASLTSSDGPFQTNTFDLSTGKVFYPVDAEPPFAAIAICPGFTNSGPEMEPWGPFYASHGFVMIAVHTIGTDSPDVRATKLLAAIDELEGENAKAGSPIFGNLSGRYGTSGYSMGGGGTTIASGMRPTLMTSVGLAAWGPNTSGVQVPTLLLCGTSDGTAPCSMSQGAYNGLPDATPKMMVSISGASHFSWFSPTGAGNGTSGEYALAFQKVFLDGDERWRSLLVSAPDGDSQSNIQ